MHNHADSKYPWGDAYFLRLALIVQRWRAEVIEKKDGIDAEEDQQAKQVKCVEGFCAHESFLVRSQRGLIVTSIEVERQNRRHQSYTQKVAIDKNGIRRNGYVDGHRERRSVGQEPEV